MSRINDTSFYLGAHVSIALIALGLAFMSPWLLLVFAWSTWWAWHYWSGAIREQTKEGE